MTTLKIQYSNYEEGEFTNEQIVDYPSFIEIFEKETNNKIYTKYSWSLENNRLKFYINTDNEYLLIIEHIAKDYYNLTFCETKFKKGYECKLEKEILTEYLNLFFNKEYDYFHNKFNKTNKKTDTIINRFNKKDFIYKISFKFLIFNIFFSILFFITTGVIMFYMSNYIDRLFIIPFAIIFIFSLITEIFKIRSHLLESLNKTVIISKGNNEIKIIINEHEYTFLKSDINKVIYYKSSKYESAFNIDYFNLYNNAQLILNNGSRINIPHILINSIIIEEKLSDIKKEIDLSQFRSINLKTNIIETF